MTHRLLSCLVLLSAGPLLGQAVHAKKVVAAGVKAKKDTPRYEVVSEWVRELVAFRALQLTGEAELKDGTDQFATLIRHSTRTIFELRLCIGQLKRMHLSGENFESLLPLVLDCYQKKIALHQELKKIAGALIGGSPRPGLDYGRLAARMPEITATLEQIDRTLFTGTQLFCIMLIDVNPNREGKLDHLVLTTAERTALVGRLDAGFGNSLEEKNPNILVSSALVLRDFLKGGHKSADDPW